MTDVGFYHLVTKPLAAVLPRLLEKALAAGFRPWVVADDAALLARLDAALWTFEADSFLSHGVAVEGVVANDLQQVILTNKMPADGCDLLVLVDGGWPENPGQFKRILYLFDGNDDAALARARGQWKALRGAAELIPTYWKETAKGWEKAG